jgi:hypothetical protein
MTQLRINLDIDAVLLAQLAFLVWQHVNWPSREQRGLSPWTRRRPC